MAILSKIRRWYFRDKLSLRVREIARRTGFSRNTVRRYLRDEISEPVYPKRRTTSKLDAFADKLAQWLSDAALTIKAGDVILMSFWMTCVSGRARYVLACEIVRAYAILRGYVS